MIDASDLCCSEGHYLGGTAAATVGVEAQADLGKGAGVGVGYAVGLGGQIGYNSKDRNAGATVITPVGSFGAKVGCKTQMCIFACFTITLC